MEDNLFKIGMYLTIFVTLPIVIAFIVFHLLSKNKQDTGIVKVIPKKGSNGCCHTSNKNLRVTAMGDDEEYFLCEKCGQKIKESELN